MSSKESRLLYMKLADSVRASFSFRNQDYTVHAALPEVFDAFISQAVEKIVNVDRETWPIFQRWRIINACLEAESLVLSEQSSGSMRLTIGSAGSEEKTAESAQVEEKAS